MSRFTSLWLWCFVYWQINYVVLSNEMFVEQTTSPLLNRLVPSLRDGPDNAIICRLYPWLCTNVCVIVAYSLSVYECSIGSCSACNVYTVSGCWQSYVTPLPAECISYVDLVWTHIFDLPTDRRVSISLRGESVKCEPYSRVIQVGGSIHPLELFSEMRELKRNVDLSQLIWS